MTASRGAVVLLVFLTAGAGFAAAPRSGCDRFNPVRRDLAGLHRPAFVITADLDEDSRSDLVVVHREAPGDVTRTGVSVLIQDASGAFSRSSFLTLSDPPWSASLGLLNQDSHVDLVIGHLTVPKVSILLGDGMGGFHAGSDVEIPGTLATVKAVDFNGDTLVDLLIATSPGLFPGSLHFLEGDGGGGLTLRATVPIGTSPRGLAVGDFLEDGSLDVVVGTRDGVTFVPGVRPPGLGTPVEVPAALGASTVASTDLNGDGHLDVVGGGGSLNSPVFILLGDGQGAFSLGQEIEMGADIRWLDLCDLGGDGTPDLVAAVFNRDSLAVSTGNGDGSFGSPLEVAVRSRPVAFDLADLDGDGACDAVSANREDHTVSILLNDGEGVLGTPHFPVHGLVPLGLATGDLDADGHLDLVTANRDSDDLSILLGDGSGRFHFGGKLRAGTRPGDVLIHDMNGDRHLDILATNQGVPFDHLRDELTLYLGDGHGSFAMDRTTKIRSMPPESLIADFDADGTPDVVTANSESKDVTLLSGGSSHPQSGGRSFRVKDRPESLASLDVDGDGRLDLAISVKDQNRIVFLMGHPNRQFVLSDMFLPGPMIRVDELISGDVNADGWLDLIWSNFSFANEAGLISVYLNDGGSGFREAPGSRLPTGTFPMDVLLVDLDAAGGPDLVVANRFDNSLTVYQGDGSGGFAHAGDYGTGNQPFKLAAGDFNEDGRMDMASADWEGGTVSILLNAGGVSCSAP